MKETTEIASLQASYDEAAADYARFYNNDIYSVLEDRAIAHFARWLAEDELAADRVRALDVGCGAGLPREIWRTLFEGRDSASLAYQGYDLSPGMIEAARDDYAKEIEAGIARFEVANARQAVYELEDDAYDLAFCLHGVLSHVAPPDVPGLLAQMARVTTGSLVLSLFSRYADCRAPEYPRRKQHECRQLEDSEPVWIHTYAIEEVRDMLSEAGLTPQLLLGLGVKGGLADIHAEFVSRQEKLAEREKLGEDVRAERLALERDVEQLIGEDLEIGRRSPERGHDIIVFARS